MAKEFASKSFSGGVDSRKSSRASRARPWLANSILRRQSAATGVKGCEGAPSQPKATTVTLGSGPAPPVTVERVAVKQSASKIPILVRRCGSASLGKGGVQEKAKSPATPSTVTGMATSASRIPVRTKLPSAGPRLAPQQVRTSKALGAAAGLPAGKEVGNKRGTGGVSAVAVSRPNPEPEAMSIQKCINPEPIRTHRSDIAVRSILKHRAKPSEEIDPQRPLDSRGNGVKSNPAEKKSVTWPEVYAIPTPARPWPKEAVPAWRCRLCRECGHRGWCPTLIGVTACSQEIDVWLREQRARGYDYLEHSGGFLSSRDHDPTEPVIF
ncbi:hypothetical protein A1O7_03368 [Cladophialophora yegresii CBS 114405]|uniref:Uncharacterized protein n=1 Tax=Cladophialophora yegresii CBS 114405 TaxID=1182544 RepID=W9WD52_9EURO|nr:uncharacterized protein A1O7_03368 [Cladophialophora yegresii CBS 114405]EXJ62925.1 hypothetical protein A1O7_03368 [Cladophialophora yegresii CBS 114405]